MFYMQIDKMSDILHIHLFSLCDSMSVYLMFWCVSSYFLLIVSIAFVIIAHTLLFLKYILQVFSGNHTPKHPSARTYNKCRENTSYDSLNGTVYAKRYPQKQKKINCSKQHSEKEPSCMYQLPDDQPPYKGWYDIYYDNPTRHFCLIQIHFI